MRAYIPEKNLYRYTCFRSSVKELLKRENRVVQILACNALGIEPKTFYDQLWQPLKLRRKTDDEEKQSALEILEESEVCLILGDTGAGKTTWQLKAVLDCVQESDPKSPLARYVPVWVDCSSPVTKEELEEGDDHFSVRIAKTAGLETKEIKQILDQHLPLLFLVDLNNAPGGTPEGQRAPLAEAIGSYNITRRNQGRAAHEKQKMIIVYRSHSHYAGDRTYDALTEFTDENATWYVQPLDSNQVRQYCRAYAELKQQAVPSEDQLEVLNRFITQHRHVVETPLLLHLLTETGFKYTQTLGELWVKLNKKGKSFIRIT